MRISRLGFIGGVTGDEAKARTDRPEYNATLTEGLNGVIRDYSGGFWKRRGTILSARSPGKLIIAQFQYNADYSCQFIISGSRIEVFEYDLLKRLSVDRLPDQYWNENDLDYIQTFANGPEFYIYCPVHEGSERPQSVFAIYENRPTANNRFNICYKKVAPFTNVPYSPAEPARRIRISKEGNNYSVEILNDDAQNPLLTADDVGRTILIARLPTNRQPAQDTGEVAPEWMEMLIAAVINGRASVRLISEDSNFYQYPETTEKWYISAFTSNTNKKAGRLGIVKGFCVHESRLWCFSGKTVIASRIDSDILDFGINNKVDSSFSKILTANINWMVSGNTLICGSMTGIYHIGATQGVRRGLTETTFGVQQISETGASKVRPVRTPVGYIFVGIEKKTLHRIFIDQGGVSMVESILPQLGNLVSESEITGLAIQRSPFCVIWMSLKNCRLISVTVSADPMQFRAAEHELGGRPTEILNISSSRLETRDVILLNVKRVSGIELVHNIETLDIGTYSSEELEKSEYLDSMISARMEDNIFDMQDADLLRIGVVGGVFPERGFLNTLLPFVEREGRIAILFRQVIGYVPDGQQPEPVDIVYVDELLKYTTLEAGAEHLGRESFYVIYNKNALLAGNRGTPRKWEFQEFYPLLQTTLTLAAIFNVNNFEGVEYAVVLAFTNELSEEQLTELCSSFIYIYGLGNIADTYVDGEGLVVENQVFTVRLINGQLVLFDTNGNYINKRLSNGDWTYLVTRAIVYVCPYRYRYEQVGNQDPAWMSLTGGYHKDAWSDNPQLPLWHNFKIKECPGMEEFENSRVVLEEDRSVIPGPDGPWKYHMYINPSGYISPTPIQNEGMKARNNKIAFYRKIKLFPVTMKRGTYISRIDRNKPQGKGSWRLTRIKKDDFLTLVGQKVHMVLNDGAYSQDIELDDAKFMTIDGVAYFPIGFHEHIYAVAFGYLYRFAFEPAPLAGPDPTMGMLDGAHFIRRPMIVGFVMSRGGKYGSTLEHLRRRGHCYRIRYPVRLSAGEEMPENVPFTGNVKMTVEKCNYDPKVSTIGIEQIASTNIAITNIIEDNVYEQW